MHDRVVLLKPSRSYRNELGETVPVWVPFHPFRAEACLPPPPFAVTEGSREIRFADGKTLADAEPFAVWAKAEPTTGREYEEAQKLRAETTWKVKMRYADGICADWKILVRSQVMGIVSVLDVGGTRRELTLICTEEADR